LPDKRPKKPILAVRLIVKPAHMTVKQVSPAEGLAIPAAADVVDGGVRFRAVATPARNSALGSSKSS
jgi:hypothetical protein